MVKKVNEPHLLKSTYHNYVVLDLETTGLDPIKDGITEIGMIKVRNDQIIAEYTHLVHPKKRIPYEITQLTGISNSMVRNEPCIEEIIDEIKEFIGDDLIMGHKVSMDLAFLMPIDDFFHQDYLDTLRYARKAFPYLQSCALSNLVNEFQLSKNTHRALADVYATKELYDLLLQKRGSIERIYSFNPFVDGIDENIVNHAFCNPYFKDHTVVLSGYFSKCSKATLERIITLSNGKTSEKITSQTTIFILGEHASTLSKKHQQVLNKIKEGQKIEIILEDDFYQMIHL